MKSTMMDTPLTVVPMLTRASRFFPQVEIVSRKPDRKLQRSTYRELDCRAHQLAAALLQAGLQRGDRVATLMWSHSVHLEAYFGVPLAGGVLHTLNLRLAPDQLAFIANHAGDRFLIVDDVLLPVLKGFIDKVHFERILVVPFSGQCNNGLEDYEHFIAQAPETVSYPVLEEWDAAAMCYTSGTTGEPKGVVYSHRALVLHTFAIALADSLGISRNDVVLPVVPMFHANAWGINFAATMVGAKQALPGPCLDPESILDLCEREQVTIASGVPTVWMGVAEQLDNNPERWSLAPNLRVMIGGSALSESLMRRLGGHGVRAFQGWGLTESTPVATVCTLKAHLASLPTDQQYEYLVTQGLPMPYMELRVMNDAGEVPPDGKTMGEVQLRGPWVAAHYYNLPDQTDKWTEDGWFRTGDVVTVNAEGYIRIVDRAKDLIKSGGEWISSVDLENAIVAHPAVKEAAVIAVPDSKWGERPLAAVVLIEGSSVTAEELSAFISPKFAKWQLPDRYIFLPELPHTSTGKLLKSELRARYSNRDRQPAA
jgi:fatty-acyl-CoA synthase